MLKFAFYRFTKNSFIRCLKGTELCLLGLLVLSSGLHARESIDSQFHGFLSQGFSKTNENYFYGDSRDQVSWDFREIGVNFSHRFNRFGFISGQILSRKSGNSSDSNAQLDFLQLDYHLLHENVHRLGFEIGRVKNPFGFYNETRDVPFTRPSVILPQSIYFDRTRDLTLSSDGVQFFTSKDFHRAVLRGQFQVAYPRVDSDKLKNILLINDKSGEFKARLSYIAKVSYEPEGRGITFAISVAQLNSDYNASATTAASFRFSPRVISLQYNTLKWSLTGEYARRPFDFNNLPLSLPLSHIEGESYYLQSTWRMTHKFSVFARYDAAYIDRNDRDGKYREQVSGGTLPAYTMFALDWSFGCRWSLRRNLELALESHWVNGAAWLDVSENPVPIDIAQRWRLLTGSFSYRF